MITINELSKKLNISKTTARNYVKRLLGLGILERLRDGYFMTKNAIKLREMILAIKSRSGIAKAPFTFTDRNGTPLQLQVKTIDQLYAVFKYKLAPKELLMHHLKQGYIQAWLKDSLGATELAESLNKTYDYESVVRILEKYVALLTELSST